MPKKKTQKTSKKYRITNLSPSETESGHYMGVVISKSQREYIEKIHIRDDRSMSNVIRQMIAFAIASGKFD